MSGEGRDAPHHLGEERGPGGSLSPGTGERAGERGDGINPGGGSLSPAQAGKGRPEIGEERRDGIRLALVGYGKMGRLVEQLAPGHGFEVGLRLDEEDNAGGSGLVADRFEGIDVAIDFSTAAAVPVTAERLAALGVPLVVGTTGWHAELPRVRETVERHDAGLLYGANFSIGVQVFYRLADAAARLLSGEASYESWLYEIHHSRKKDAPSGTLLEIRRVLEVAGWDRAIDVASNRAGAIPGTHQVGFDSEADTITLQHTARSRAGFAHGALRAARWMIGRRGLYEFSRVWEEIVRGADPSRPKES